MGEGCIGLQCKFHECTVVSEDGVQCFREDGETVLSVRLPGKRDGVSIAVDAFGVGLPLHQGKSVGECKVSLQTEDVAILVEVDGHRLLFTGKYGEG